MSLLYDKIYKDGLIYYMSNFPIYVLVFAYFSQQKDTFLLMSTFAQKMLTNNSMQL